MGDQLLPNRASGFGEPRQTCAHCGVTFTADKRWENICPDCFIIGHRGFKCDEHCQPDKTLPLLVASLRARGEEKGGDG